jgi:arylsulfatase A-like enzyme
VSEGDERAIQPYFRQKICGLVAAVDLNILQVVLALAAADMLSSTLILFHPDNGGFIQAGSLNLPFNHQKATYYDGGVRVPAFIYNAAQPSLSGHTARAEEASFVRDDLFDVTDVLPTLMGYAGISARIAENELDGINHWDHLLSGEALLRTFTPLYSSSSQSTHYSGGYVSVIDGVRWKYGINARATEAIMTQRFQNYTLEGEVLFNLNDDMGEHHNLAPTAGRVVDEKLLNILNELREKSYEVRANSIRTSPALGSGWPPRLRFYPSPLGCWLPLDSPLYETAKCLEKAPFIPKAWLNDPDVE